MTDKEFQSFKEKVEEYGRACADVAEAQAWGSGVAGAVISRREAFEAVIACVEVEEGEG